MIKKEINDVGKQLLYFLVLWAVGTFGFEMVEMWRYHHFNTEALWIMIAIGMLVFPVLLGLSAFASERKQRGIEYMLTMPCSRSRILLAKLLSRLVAIMIWAVLMVILYYALGVTTLSGYGVLTVIEIGLLLLIVSFSLSASTDNFLALFIVACGAFVLIYTSLYFIEPAGLALMNVLGSLSIFEVWKFEEFGYTIRINLLMILTCLLVIPFIASFVLAFRKFDIKSSRDFNVRQLKYFVLLYIFCSVASIIIFIVDLSMRYFG